MALRSAFAFAAAALALALALMTGGCASMNTPPAELQAAKTIGIISAIGDDFTLTRAGLTGPAETERHASIEAWGLDDLIGARAGSRLGQRFQVKPVTYPRAPFAAREQASAFTPLNLRSGRDAALKELVRNQVLPQGLDAYVVITKAESAYGSRGRKAAGIGVIENVAVFGSTAVLHALYTIHVIDGHSFKVISKRAASPLQNAGVFRMAGPSREIDAELASAAQNPAASEAVKAAVIELIDRSLATTMQDVQLVDRSGS
ncbi:MAG: hypothetical protein JOY90_32385 [Bradyrhizobium sp.]|uniref:hypothetical protein n=1 Tax=Bradyrhizobium sp. TaxID=376 RepID=UPI001DC009CF|nr:hypothetical protein [Bradyrhizobium sp.]MBV9565113.1 hypothetical protein [Bradyrhizobium sp.]